MKSCFLKQIVTSDEKWIFCNHVKWKRLRGKQNEPPPTSSKAGLHPKKVMLCTWWDWKGVLFYEVLPENQIINFSKYCVHVDQQKTAIQQKKSEINQQKMLHLPLG